jgi:calcineurin-like phosphoesterase family protein
LHQGDLTTSGDWVSKDISDARSVEMSEVLISNWNSVVSPGDKVFHLGDFSFKKNILEIRKRLNGEIHLVVGNHDRIGEVNKAGFEWVTKDSLSINIEGVQFVMSHRPLINTTNEVIHLHGHCHGTKGMLSQSNVLDVGVDVHKFFPISLGFVLSLVRRSL